MAASRIRKTPFERIEYAIICSTLLLMVVVTVQPILNLLAVSLSDSAEVPGMSGLELLARLGVITHLVEAETHQGARRFQLRVQVSGVPQSVERVLKAPLFVVEPADVVVDDRDAGV